MRNEWSEIPFGQQPEYSVLNHQPTSIGPQNDGFEFSNSSNMVGSGLANL